MANPIFPAVPKTGLAQVSTANTARDGSGTIVDAVTAGTNGYFVERAIIRATGTTTGGMVRVFLHNTTNYRLIAEVPVEAITPSSVIEAFSAYIDILESFPLSAGWKIAFSTHNAETFNCFVIGGDY